jgi:hypothetical protein
MNSKPGFGTAPTTFHPNDPQAEIKLLRASLAIAEDKLIEAEAYLLQKDEEIATHKEQVNDLSQLINTLNDSLHKAN